LQLSSDRTARPRLANPRCTGGKSGRGLRRLDPHLGRRLKRPSLKLHQHVPTAFLGTVDQVPIGRGIHRVGHFPHRLLKILTHPPNQFIPINLRQAIHGNSFSTVIINRCTI
jgi:hypothetical protein